MSAQAPLSEPHVLGVPASNDHFTAYKELVIVCCHAICENAPSAVREDSWRMQPFQRSDATKGKSGEHETFLLHIAAAAMISSYRASALVMFSGGRTTDSELSEARSYEQVFCKHGTVDGSRNSVGHHAALEEHATDSYQNLLFSILKYRKMQGEYPRTVTVITHAFKERRFLELHAAAIKWPRSRLRVQGINPPFTLDELDQTQKGELERGYELFAIDPYGVRSPLADKRKARRWDPEVIEDLGIEPEVKALLMWTGGESGSEIYPGTLPWES